MFFPLSPHFHCVQNSNSFPLRDLAQRAGWTATLPQSVRTGTDLTCGRALMEGTWSRVRMPIYALIMLQADLIYLITSTTWNTSEACSYTEEREQGSRSLKQQNTGNRTPTKCLVPAWNSLATGSRCCAATCTWKREVREPRGAS
jgi:hypothetical protein